MSESAPPIERIASALERIATALERGDGEVAPQFERSEAPTNDNGTPKRRQAMRRYRQVRTYTVGEEWRFKEQRHRERPFVSEVEGDCIYFLQQGEWIKIGHSSDVATRLASLQAGSPTPHVLIGIQRGNVGAERALHDRFAHVRGHGEWFRLGVEDIADEIDVWVCRDRWDESDLELCKRYADCTGADGKGARFDNVGGSGDCQ